MSKQKYSTIDKIYIGVLTAGVLINVIHVIVSIATKKYENLTFSLGIVVGFMFWCLVSFIYTGIKK